MARPVQSGLSYFSFDVNFFSDRKIKILKARYGSDGVTLYMYLLCLIYQESYYLKVDDDFIYITCEELNMSQDKVMQVLNFLLERSLFNDKLFQSDKVLTSAGIQKRYQLGVKTRATKRSVIVERYWLLDEDETATFIKVNSFSSKSKINPSYSKINPSYSEINDTKESKVKESKVKESVALPQNDYDQLINKHGKATVDEYIKRTSKYKSCNVITIEKWIKEDRDKQNGSRSSKTTNNFEQRDYDLDMIQKQLLTV